MLRYIVNAAAHFFLPLLGLVWVIRFNECYFVAGFLLLESSLRETFYIECFGDID